MSRQINTEKWHVAVLTWRRLCLYDRHNRNPETSHQHKSVKFTVNNLQVHKT